MGDQFPRIKAAAVHAASPFLDRDAGVEKACALIGEAAAEGADLIVFPETFIPGYPVWIWTHTPATGAPFFSRLFANSVEVPSEATDRIGAAARKASSWVVVGISERDGGTLYNTLLYFDDSGRIVGKHRKLVPTCVERTVWGRGDGSGLKLIDAPFGKLGGLICWEHSMDLARYALTSQGEQIHIAAWPAGSAVSHDPSSGVFDNLTKFIVWTLPTNLGEGLIILVASVFSLTLPITPVQILWINMTTAVLLGLTLAFEPREEGIMTRPPRESDQPLLNREIIVRTLFVGTLLCGAGIGLFEFMQHRGWGEASARTVAVNVIVFGELFYLFNCRSLVTPLTAQGFFSNPWVFAGSGTMIALQLLMTYAPFMNRLFGTQPIDVMAWLAILACSAVIFLAVTIEKRVRLRGQSAASRHSPAARSS